MQTRCSNCGAPIGIDDKVCGQCNTIQESFRYRSRMGAAAIAFFTGWFGGHRFFLGQWWGLFYLFFFWTYIPAIIAWIEGIVFLATDQVEWNKRHNHGIYVGKEGGTVVVIIFGLILPLVLMVGILAAIAIPSYMEYTQKASISEGLMATAPYKIAVAEYYLNYGDLPRNAAEAGVPAFQPTDTVSNVEVRNGSVYVKMADSGITGHIILKPQATDSGISWSCTESTLEPSRLLPSSCR
ncbi:pilin [Halochromatium salexigens]|uniref:TM2 domain-containing protein n=1 Tax=Halochromatium salexigens TaxID=49447 RepID=A0AAJ0XFW4_HALSE|nr:pilin [Halochromatium salexigens]MBK5930122.1 hypothetical protein [Halochromatium salexigens]